MALNLPTEICILAVITVKLDMVVDGNEMCIPFPETAEPDEAKTRMFTQ